MTAPKERRKIVKVRDAKSEWGMLFLNIFTVCSVAVAGYTANLIGSIYEKVSSIDTATQLTKQKLEIHEAADKNKFADLSEKIKELKRRIK